MQTTMLLLCCIALLPFDNWSVNTSDLEVKQRNAPTITAIPRKCWGGFMRNVLAVINETIPHRKCKYGLTKKEMNSLLRSAYFKKWTVVSIMRLLDNDLNCTVKMLRQVVDYGTWSWWEKLIQYCTNDGIYLKEMKEIIEWTSHRKFIQAWYFPFVEIHQTRCNVNQLVAALRYKTKITSYMKWRYARNYYMPLLKVMCNSSDLNVTYNSRVVLEDETVLKTHPSHVVSMYKHCSPTIAHPWTVRGVLLWLQNCTKVVEYENCCRNYCQLMDLANQLKCEAAPCFRNVMIIASTYNQTQTELLKIFRYLVESRLKKCDNEKFYKVFEKTILFFLKTDNTGETDRASHHVEVPAYIHPNRNTKTMTSMYSYNQFGSELQAPLEPYNTIPGGSAYSESGENYNQISTNFSIPEKSLSKYNDQHDFYMSSISNRKRSQTEYDSSFI